ncbi:Golgi CORVET complex core vacuolar protein 8-domain-containing protein [Tuber brumale]|nr:Golgi CORVET complex core vacuolar protein 8-domain-containing protein [Tuber brumale]
MSSISNESSVPETSESNREGNGQEAENVEVMRDLNEGELEVNGGVPESMTNTATSRVLEYLQEAREEENGTAFRGFKQAKKSTDNEHPDLSNSISGETSPAGSLSTPDDTPSIQGSVASSRGGSILGSRFSPAPSLRPFDRRFQSRLQPTSPIGSPSPRALSPSLLGPHSRSSSTGDISFGEAEEQSAPWDIVRWTKLKKIKNQVFSEGGRRNFGTPTCIVASATIALGTSRGIVLVFDYNQSLQGIIGPGTKAVEHGAISALAVSADHTTIAGGHDSGHIFTWELNKPSQPFLHIPPLPLDQVEGRKTDGHVEGVSVIHLGFLGTRHTALVSGDDRGMAFSHLATRGLGAVRRVVKTTRILGRYPFDANPALRPRKPSSVLGFSVLPLGNFQQATDTLGLVALLTPNLLVIVSTTPIAQTQYKAAKPKEVAADSALSGCLAWYPFMKAKQAANGSKSCLNARLVYAWSNILTLLELSVVETEDNDPTRPPVLDFRPKSRFRCDEAIVAVQWINRQIIGVLTVTQRLIILEDTSLRATETFDLMPKQILHLDIFSGQLHSLIDRLDDEGSSHPHVADAFYNSFKAYKGRMFLLCQYEVLVGALSNWADRLLAMMEVGDFIGAIHLATAYYVGEANKLTIGLPEDAELRHPIVRERLLEMMSASLRYAFGKNQKSTQKEVLEREQLQDLAIACFSACLSMDTTDFLFGEAFEHFEQGSVEGIFLETLEPHILEGRIRSVPPTVVKALITHYTSREFDSRLEEIICHMDTRTLDIDQVTTLCKQHNLYDAMIYVWNRALGDYITPMIDLLSLLIPPFQNGVEEGESSMHAVNALKVFPYLSYTLTGRVYPTGEDLSEPDASNAKAALYYFLFLGRTITWPKQGGKQFYTGLVPKSESSFPYLRLILKFDAPSFLSALNEAFENPFLNSAADSEDATFRQDVSEEQAFCQSSMNRQYIVSILLEVMGSTDFPPQDTIYLDMFIARNIPKYPQFILLSGSALHRVIVGLCNCPGEDIADDCQLSIEYLLTVYRPPDIDVLVELFTNAKFFRVLKSIFRSEKQYARLTKTCFEDGESQDAVFDCIWDYLRPDSSLNEKQTKEVRRVIEQHARQLMDIDCARTATIINTCAPDLHDVMLDSIEDRPRGQFQYLQTILEPSDTKEGNNFKRPAVTQNVPFVELYIQLMCEFEPDHVNTYVGGLQSGDLRLDKVLPAMESSGVMDAAVMLMAREGEIRKAMDRLITHLGTLEIALESLLVAGTNAHSSHSSNEAISGSLRSLQKYAQVGVWLCQGQMKTGKQSLKAIRSKHRSNNEPLNEEELLWLDFVDTVVRIARNCISIQGEPPVSSRTPKGAGGALSEKDVIDLDSEKVAVSLRMFVQTVFSALLTATSSSRTVSFLQILRAFLFRASKASPSLGDLRNVLGDIFEAYIYEEQILALANRLLEKDLFVHVDEAATLRQKGWRPANQTCEACNKKLWGPGAAGGIYSAWEKARLKSAQRLESIREERKLASEGPLSAVARGKSRARVTADLLEETGEASGGGNTEEEEAGELVVFHCRHIFHRKCLDSLLAENGPSDEWAFKCIVCKHNGY